MKINKSIKLGIFFLIGILLLTSFVMAYYRSQTNYVQYGPYDKTGLLGTGMYQDKMCQAGQDFILQVSPLGCEPAMVRSDLLEEQNAFVMCPISATQMNPLIDVQAINTMTITGKYPPEVATVGFHPAEGALNPYQNKLSQPVILDNIGYAVIVLRKQENESAMPDYVEGNLTARIRYDIQNAFGVGQSSFYLPVLNEDGWAEKYKQYSFWDGRGYLRAEGVYDDEATISIYSDQSRSGILGQGDNKMIYSTVTLRKGETSNELYIPGFDFCLATMRIRLDDLEDPDTRARFRVNGNPVEVKSGERFLENNCWVIGEPVKNGINSEVKFTCREDREGFHTGTIHLKIIPNISLEFDGVENNVAVGDYLYMNKDGDKKVFLAYADTVANTGDEEDLFVYLMAIPKEDHTSDKLTLDEIQSAKIVAEGYKKQTEESNIFGWIKTAARAVVGASTNFLNWVLDGDNFQGIKKDEGVKDRFGKQVELLGFAGVYDSQLPKEVEDKFNLAVEDYRAIVDGYPDEINSAKDETLGESALYGLINLANKVGQKRTMSELCEEFEQTYPNSKTSLEVCKDKMKLSSSTNSVTEVLIDDHVYQISFEGVYEPTAYEYSAKVRVNSPSGEVSTYTLTKNDVIYLNPSDNEYIMLNDLEENSAELKLNIRRSTTLGNLIEDKSEWILLNAPESFNSGYTLTLLEVNLKKVAKVSLIPNIDYAQTNASFNFRINIDKRNIQLSPEKTQEKIEKLDRDIEKWSSVSENLGKFVRTMKTACLGTSAYLTVKNYLENTGGKGIARDSVMNDEDGWYNLCDDWVSQGIVRPGGNGQAYGSQEECLIKESDNIDKDVNDYYEFMSAEQKYLEDIQKDHVLSEEKLFSQQIINTSAVAGEISGDVKDNLDSLGPTFLDPEGKGDPIDISEMRKVLSQEGYDQNKYEIEQLRDIDLYTKILDESDNERLKEMASQSLYTTFLDIQINSKEYRELQDLASKYGTSKVIFGSSKQLAEYSLSNPSTFGEVKSINSFTGGDSIDSSTPIVIYKDQTNAKEYLFVLDGDFVITQTYSIDGDALSISDEKDTNPLSIGFEKYNDASYKNEYTNPKVRYYETEPYKGYPAIVPFDLEEGWYVSVSQGLPVFGEQASYSKSGRVESYYLCNVGRNGREESRKGDDICRSINSLSGEAIDQFPGISDKGKATALIRKASEAVMQAQNEYKTGVRQVTIFREQIEVGNPAVDLPGMKCQDFMSPKDCNTLFNVCDPVVCPSSRCDFGGNYPVQDVVQSGIIGSIALCLPNAKEGIYVPVCLTGIQAGLDGLLSIFSSYQDCLQESLDTGQTVGICDEIQSVYLCEYFYRQAIPLAKLGIPKLTELIIGGRGSRGGGEYLGVADAWQRAETSLGYFTQYYAQNSYKAFKARSMEEAGQEIVCDKFLSISYPGGNLLDAITTPDSPVQFYGRFDEIPYTSVTNPPQSQYKVYYHIYAGKDRGAYYRVYFKGDISSSFYQDTMFRIDIATGYIPKGEYASNTEDFTAPAGYKELCIMVNGQEECGFKEVTTNFAANYIGDSYLADQASQTDIKTESDCISGTSSLYSLLNPNLQAGAEDLISPSLYNEGVIRICATRNPGEGTDPKAGQEDSRWREVGDCGDNNLKCWLDTQSVKKAIAFENLEEDVLETTNKNYQKILAGEGKYLTEDAFESSVEKIGNTRQNIEKINLINEIIDKVFFNNEKASLLYLRGNAYASIAIELYNELHRECSFGEATCEGSKIMRCSTEGRWDSFIDCALTKQICHRESSTKAKCITSAEADELLGIDLDTVESVWTLDSAIDYIKALNEEDEYSDHKEFIDELCDEGILTEKECKKIIGEKAWGGVVNLEKDMKYVKNLLLDKQSTQEKEDKKEIETFNELTQKFEEQINEWGWNSWEDVTDSFKNSAMWNNIEKNMVLNAESCDDCGKGIGLCNEAECIAIGFKLRDVEGLNKMCVYDGLWSCEEVSIGENTEPIVIPGGETCLAPPEVDPSIEVINNANLQVLKAISNLAGTVVPKNLDVDSNGITNCFDPAKHVYDSAGVSASCIYSDKKGTKYNVFGTTIETSSSYPFFVNEESCSILDKSGSDKLNIIDKGYLLSYAYDGTQGHNVVFVRWDPAPPNARVFGWKKISGGDHIFDYSTVDLSDTSNPVLMMWQPKL